MRTATDTCAQRPRRRCRLIRCHEAKRKANKKIDRVEIGRRFAFRFIHFPIEFFHSFEWLDGRRRQNVRRLRFTFSLLFFFSSLSTTLLLSCGNSEVKVDWIFFLIFLPLLDVIVVAVVASFHRRQTNENIFDSRSNRFINLSRVRSIFF